VFAMGLAPRGGGAPRLAFAPPPPTRAVLEPQPGLPIKEWMAEDSGVMIRAYFECRKGEREREGEGGGGRKKKCEE